MWSCAQVTPVVMCVNMERLCKLLGVLRYAQQGFDGVDVEFAHDGGTIPPG